MKILVAPGPFKGTLSSIDAAEIIADGILSVEPGLDVELCPLADGGMGTLDIVLANMGGEMRSSSTVDAMWRPLNARWGLCARQKNAVIESAEIIGLSRIARKDRNPFRATSYGLGQVIKDALQAGVEEIVVGLGDTATVDAGFGVARSLNVLFFDRTRKPLEPEDGLSSLAEVVRIDLTEIFDRLSSVRLIAAIDTFTPLCGPSGLVSLYGPQKGVEQDQLISLEQMIVNYANRIEETTGVRVHDLPGASAGGGIAATMHTLLGAELVSGFDMVASAAGLVRRFDGVDLILTGEGRLDRQTAYGKVPYGVAHLARKHGIPVIAIAGVISGPPELVSELALDGVIDTLTDFLTMGDVSLQAHQMLKIASQRLMQVILVGARLAH